MQPAARMGTFFQRNKGNCHPLPLPLSDGIAHLVPEEKEMVHLYGIRGAQQHADSQGGQEGPGADCGSETQTLTTNPTRMRSAVHQLHTSHLDMSIWTCTYTHAHTTTYSSTTSFITWYACEHRQSKSLHTCVASYQGCASRDDCHPHLHGEVTRGERKVWLVHLIPTSHNKE